MKKLGEVPRMRSETEELELLQSNDFETKRQYICWYGFKSERAQEIMASGDGALGRSLRL